MTRRMSEIEKPTGSAKSASKEARKATAIKVEPVRPEKPVKRKEINGPKGLEPTRYGDWESKGRCHDF